MKKIFFTLVVLNLLFCTTLYLVYPASRVYLTGEDLVVEDMTAILFFIAAALSLVFFFKTTSKEKWIIFPMVFFPAALFFLDEISFGERIFNLKMPTVGGGKVDGLHDIFRMILLKVPLLPFAVRTGIYIGVVALVIAAAMLLFKFRKQIFASFGNILRQEAFFFLMACVVFLMLSIAIDLEILHFKILFLYEELFEMNAGLSLVFSAISGYLGLKAIAQSAPAMAMRHNAEDVQPSLESLQ